MMNSADLTPVTISVDETRQVSGLLETPAGARACYVLAHGAGAGMTHPFLSSVATGLATRSIATLRYQFPYMEQGSKRPDSPAVAKRTVRAAVRKASELLPGLPLFAGGKSFGGRMTSQAQAELPLSHLHGLVFFGFPLHPPKQPSNDRAKHLFDVDIPMLFLQGTRDEFAELALLQGVVGELGSRATLKLIDDADHSFHVPARTGRKDPEIRELLLDTAVDWMTRTILRQANEPAAAAMPPAPNLRK